MARRERFEVPGGVYHVMLRGNGGQPVVETADDRATLDDLVGDGVERFGHRIHAYCWMTNHLHLCVQTGDVPLSVVVQNLAFRYARAFNAARRRVGHAFQGRYRALLVADDAYFLSLIRYVHRNPVEAGLVADPADWPACSHGAYLGRRAAPPWLDMRETFARLGGARLGGDRALARRRLRALVEDVDAGAFAEAAETYAEAFAGGEAVLGDAPRRGKRARREPPWTVGARTGVPFRPTPKPDAARKKAGLVPDPPSPAALLAAAAGAVGVAAAEATGPGRGRRAALARGLAALLAVELRAATQAEMARHVGRDQSSLGRALAGARAALAADRGLLRRTVRARRALVAAAATRAAK